LKKELVRTKRELDDYRKKESKLLLKSLNSRKSIRKFSGKEVHWKIIYNIIESAFTAPAAGNIKNYKFIIVSDKEERIELGKLCFQQYWLSDAPYIIVVVREDSSLKELYPNLGGKYAIQNTAVAIENLLLAAHFYDLGTCWVEAFNSDAIKDFLEIPQSHNVDAIIPIGYPLESPKKKEILARSKIFFDKFGNIYKDKKYN